MLMLISPAKTLKDSVSTWPNVLSQPGFLTESQQLITLLRQYDPLQLVQLMGISDNLARLNVGRFHDWTLPFTQENARPAVYMFKGDVYEGIDVGSLAPPALTYLQHHLRILSGLYGVLRPLDLMQAYRLEMGTRLANPLGKDLYAFWGDKITQAINVVLAQQENPVLVNLASEEYSKSVKWDQLDGAVVTPVFQDYKNGKYKIISFYAKRARGLMVRWAATHAVTDPESLKAFDSEGYVYEPSLSDDCQWLFRRHL